MSCLEEAQGMQTMPRPRKLPKRERVLYVPVSRELSDRLDAQLARSRRTVTAEVTLALERWLAQQEREAARKGGDR
jgi:hypothetical protein